MSLRIHALNTVEMDILGLDQILLYGGSGLEGGFGASCVCPFAYRPELSLPEGYGHGKIQPGEGMINPAPMFYIEGGGKKILVESGLSQANVDVFNECAKKYGINQYYRKNPEHDVDMLLESRGVTAAEIDIVIPTHLHVDHSLNLEHYPNAEILIQRDSIPWMVAPPRWAPYMFPEFVPYFTRVLDRIHTIEGDRQVIPGVRIKKVGGHVPGHVIVEVDTAEGTAIITGDIALNYAHIEQEWPAGTFWNGDEVLEAYEYIRANADIVVPSHDFELWERHPNGIIG